MFIVSIPERIMRAHRKSLKPIMGPGSAFDCPVILLDDVIQVLALSDPDARFPLSVDGLEGGEIGPNAVQLRFFLRYRTV
jgi:hypothetical protein